MQQPVWDVDEDFVVVVVVVGRTALVLQAGTHMYYTYTMTTILYMDMQRLSKRIPTETLRKDLCGFLRKIINLVETLKFFCNRIEIFALAPTGRHHRHFHFADFYLALLAKYFYVYFLRWGKVEGAPNLNS